MALLGIYILVVAQFGLFKLPLVVLTPIPLMLIGIMIGHWRSAHNSLFDAGARRFKPLLLTAMIDAAVNLFDPIFSTKPMYQMV